MIIKDEKKYKSYIDEEVISKIEEQLNIKCLFGGAFSTCVYEINNEVSDFDFYIVFDRQDTNVKMYRYFNEKSLSDIVMLDMEHIRISNQEYYKTIDAYPSILNRDETVSTPLFNLHRNDFTSQTIFEILYSDYIWDSGYLKTNYKNCLGELSFVGVLDYYFSRAYGNLNNHLKGKEVHAQRYLMTFLGLSCIKWLLQYKTLPCMKFEYMYAKYCPQEYKSFLLDTYRKQIRLKTEKSYKYHTFNVGTHNLFEIASSEMDKASALQTKPLVFVSKNDYFNDWLERELEKVACEISLLSLNERKTEIKLGTDAFIARYFVKDIVRERML